MPTFLKRLRAFRAAARARGCSAFTHIRWLGAWARAQRKGASSMTDESPWMTFPAIAFLEKTLRPGMRVFEWGSGGSTLFFAQRAKELIAIENDAAWAEKVRAACPRATIEHIPQDDTPSATDFDPTDPAAFFSNSALHRGATFRRYAERIAAFPDAHFDLVVVDGRARPSCIAQAMPKLKPGGWLLLDNAERPWYARARALLDAWPMRDFTGPGPYVASFWQTVVWQKM
jgi:Methyltransferase domain